MHVCQSNPTEIISQYKTLQKHDDFSRLSRAQYKDSESTQSDKFDNRYQGLVPFVNISRNYIHHIVQK